MRTLYDNLGRDETLAARIDGAVRASIQDQWRNNAMKTRRVRRAIEAILGADDARVDSTLDIVKNQNDY